MNSSLSATNLNTNEQIIATPSVSAVAAPATTPTTPSTVKPKKTISVIASTGIKIPDIESSSVDDIDAFLNKKIDKQSTESWNNLDRTAKLRKLTVFADVYAAAHGLTEVDRNALVVFFRDTLEKKKLIRVKEVQYDKESGTVSDIPGLYHLTGSGAIGAPVHFHIRAIAGLSHTASELVSPTSSSLATTRKNKINLNKTFRAKK